MTGTLPIALLCIVMFVLTQENLAIVFRNTDFESINYNGNWEAYFCQMSPSNDSYTGLYSVHLFKRNLFWNGLRQTLNLQGDKSYSVLFYVKLLSNLQNADYQLFSATMFCKDLYEHDVYKEFGTSLYVQHGLWYAIGGVRTTPPGSHSCFVYLQTPSPTEYLVDHASIKEVTLDSSWKTEAEQKINLFRKAHLQIRLVGEHNTTTNVSIELEQMRTEFAFGSVVNAEMITNPSYQTYQQLFYDTFEWASLEHSLTWNATEPRQGVFHYDLPVRAINTLREHSIHVRGDNVFWADDQKVQNWVKSLTKTELLSEIDERIQRVVALTKGALEHWDVNKDEINYDFYAKHTGNPNITMEMFKKVHVLDGNTKLFLNENGVLSGSENPVTVALMDRAKRFLKAGIPLGGIGIQGHMQDINMVEVWENLNILERTGLPVFITELTINETDDTIKAQKLEDLLTMFYSHPAVEGVILGGFWDGSMSESDLALFTGSSVTPNAAGRKLQELLKTRWRTNIVGSILDTRTWHTRAFKGAYKLNIKHDNVLIKTEYFSLADGGQTLELHLDGVQDGHPHVSHIIVG